MKRFNVFIFLQVSQCPWLTPTDTDDLFQCGDGSFCDKNTEGWRCCESRQGRLKCPKNLPKMCADTNCFNNNDYCCQTNCNDKGGDRDCRK